MSSNIKQTVIFIGYYLITMITYYAVHASHNNNQCTYETKQDKIINIQESKRLGANLLEALQMNSLADCTAACCDQFYGKCNMAFYHETNKEEKNCFLALCDPEEKCVLTTLKGFAATTIFQPEVPSKDKSFLTTLLNELEEEFEKEGEVKAAITNNDIIVENKTTTVMTPLVELVPTANTTNTTTTAATNNDIFVEDNTTTVMPVTELAPEVTVTNNTNSNETGKLTKCNKALLEASAGKALIGSYVPQCTKAGEYETMQCHGSTGYCWCVDENGEEIQRTKAGPGSAQPNCEGKSTKCQKAVLEASAGQALIGSYVPQCTKTGEYETMQCHGSTGYCWCVDENGEEIQGTKAGRGNPQPNCDVSKEKDLCPSTEGMFGICIEECSINSDCTGEQICCSNGCGHTCLNPGQKESTNNQNPVNKAAATVKQTTTTTTTNKPTTERRTTRTPTTTMSATTKTIPSTTTQRTTTQKATTARRRTETTETKSKSTTAVPSKTTTQDVLEPQDSRNIELPSGGNNKTAAASVNQDKKDDVTVSYLSSNGALVAAMCFGVLFLAAVCVLVGKRWYEGYQRRHYNKMDYLINGMYN
ncbi:uncharacterized protein [Amphiura filiformis]|uniref:uncharacterized protein isoform X3 n=1 Tax=Amphiura filiformis TaxID=82378 RepID=UPI003B20CB1F